MDFLKPNKDYTSVVAEMIKKPIQLDSQAIQTTIDTLTHNINETLDYLNVYFDTSINDLTDFVEEFLFLSEADIMIDVETCKFVMDKHLIDIGYYIMNDSVANLCVDDSSRKDVTALVTALKTYTDSSIELVTLKTLKALKDTVTMQTAGNYNGYMPAILTKSCTKLYVKPTSDLHTIQITVPNLKAKLLYHLAIGDYEFKHDLTLTNTRIWGTSMSEKALYSALLSMSEHSYIRLEGKVGTAVTSSFFSEVEERKNTLQRTTITFNNALLTIPKIATQLLWQYLYCISNECIKLFNANQDDKASIRLVGEDYIILEIDPTKTVPNQIENIMKDTIFTYSMSV